MKERIQKVLAREGLGSRREIESWIRAGRLMVNSRVAELGQLIDHQDKVLLDRRAVALSPVRVVPLLGLMYHKPEGQICTRKDPEGRDTVFTHLPELPLGRWVAVGRLDINTSGIILFTTDGDLANSLMHPRFEVSRVYISRIFGEATDAQKQALLDGVEIDGERMAFDAIQTMEGEGTSRWYRVTLREGKNREVRKLWESQGLRVSRLMRVKYGPIDLPKSVRPGETKELSPAQMNLLREAVMPKVPS